MWEINITDMNKKGIGTVRKSYVSSRDKAQDIVTDMINQYSIVSLHSEPNFISIVIIDGNTTYHVILFDIDKAH